MYPKCLPLFSLHLLHCAADLLLVRSQFSGSSYRGPATRTLPASAQLTNGTDEYECSVLMTIGASLIADVNAGIRNSAVTHPDPKPKLRVQCRQSQAHLQHHITNLWSVWRLTSLHSSSSCKKEENTC